MQHLAIALLLLVTGGVRPYAPAAPLGGMARIPAGRYVPLFREPGRSWTIHVPAFAMDVREITRAEYLAFVRAHPEWRRDAIKPLFAEPAYLRDWSGNLNAGGTTELQRPVTYVSWFAAKAYCAWRGKRLPTVDEWEYVAAASEIHGYATNDATFTRRTRAYGVAGLHGVVWEWVYDFNSVLLSNDSRSTADRDLHLYCASGALGATDPKNYAAFLRYGVRAGLTGRTTIGTLGFRCAQSL